METMDINNAANSDLKRKKIENFINDQNFDNIKSTHSKNNLFVDLHFPANDKSIYFTNIFFNKLAQSSNLINEYKNKIKWKRATEIASPNKANFIIDANGNGLKTSEINQNNFRAFFDAKDLDQGKLGNCWFISAASGVIQNFELLKRVIPLDNSFEDKDYTGAFHFRFWVNGVWKDVVVDDFLPIDKNNNLIFCKNSEKKNEFWCALLEKAYAKLYGSYESLDGGLIAEALIDLSGGIQETFNLKDINLLAKPFDKDKFWNILCDARQKSSVIGCEIMRKNGGRELTMKNGLVQAHAYSLTNITELSLNGKNYRLIRLYNPWGNEVEWNGEWSDKSLIWNQIESSVKKNLEFASHPDGEFWMDYDDWIENFHKCYICNLTPNIVDEILAKKSEENIEKQTSIYTAWQCKYLYGKWERGVEQGRENLKNPMIPLVIAQSDIKNERCWVIISLMQMNTRQERNVFNPDATEKHIHFKLFKVKSYEVFVDKIKNEKKFDLENDLIRIGNSGPFVNLREVSARFSLNEGGYIIIPWTFDPNDQGEFLIRIFTEQPLQTSIPIAIESCGHFNNDFDDDKFIDDVNEDSKKLTIERPKVFGDMLVKYVRDNLKN